MNKSLIILFFIIPFLTACNIENADVYFSVNGPYSNGSELIVNGKNYGELTKFDLDKVDENCDLSNLKLIHVNLEVKEHDIVVVNGKDTINHIKWTLRKDGSWHQRGIPVNLNLRKVVKGTSIKKIRNSFLIELFNK